MLSPDTCDFHAMLITRFFCVSLLALRPFLPTTCAFIVTCWHMQTPYFRLRTHAVMLVHDLPQTSTTLQCLIISANPRHNDYNMFFQHSHRSIHRALNSGREFSSSSHNLSHTIVTLFYRSIHRAFEPGRIDPKL